jgi:hypothetical protein
MQWRKASAWYQVSDCGYTVSKSVAADGAQYSAWGPDAAAGWSYREFAKGQCAHWAGEQLRERYRNGEPIPQRFALLGCRGSVAAARTLCEEDAATKAAGV